MRLPSSSSSSYPFIRQNDRRICKVQVNKREDNKSHKIPYLCLFMLTGAVEYCLPESFNVTCAVDEIIMVTSAQYGRMRSGRCIKQNYGHVGCEADVTAFVEDECSGRRRCQFPVAKLLSVASPCPPDVTSYLDATYSCVKGKVAWLGGVREMTHAQETFTRNLHRST